MIKEKINKILKKIIYGAQADENSYIKFLRKKGIVLGEGCRFFAPEYTIIDIQNPHMIRIGNNVRFTKGVTLLTHDYSFSVLSGVDGSIVSGIEPVTIGNNVFIGNNTVILKGTVIKDNVIIGAGSIVSGVLEADSVYAGVPAKKISTLKEYELKRNNKLIKNALVYIDEYMDRFGKLPSIDDMYEFFFLFKFDNIDNVPIKIRKFVARTGYEKMVWSNYFSSDGPKYRSVEELAKLSEKVI